MLKQVVKCIARERKFVNKQLACQWISAVTGWMTYRISVRFLLPISQAVTSNLQTPRKQPCTSPNFRTCAQSTARTLVARQLYNSCTRQREAKVRLRSSVQDGAVRQWFCVVGCRVFKCHSCEKWWKWYVPFIYLQTHCSEMMLTCWKLKLMCVLYKDVDQHVCFHYKTQPFNVVWGNHGCLLQYGRVSTPCC